MKESPLLIQRIEKNVQVDETFLMKGNFDGPMVQDQVLRTLLEPWIDFYSN